MFERIVCWDNLLRAYRGASRGKRPRACVAAFEHRLEDNLVALRQELRSGGYRPGAYRSFYIHEPKRRLISAAPFRDRVVHHALCHVIEPPFERRFVAESFANRPGKGTHRALRLCQALARRYRYVLQCDVRQFFPSVDHAILRRTLARKIGDERVLDLIDRILESGEGVLSEEYETVCFPGDDLFAVLRPRGLPIGNLTSQFWANVYLDPIDHFVKRPLRVPGYVRYVDDLLLFSDDKKALWGFKERLEHRLEERRLVIHPGAHPRPVTEGIPFLGFVTFPQRRRLKKRKGVAFRRRLTRLREQVKRGVVSPEKERTVIGGWVEHVRYANTIGLQRAVLCANDS